MNRRNDVEDHQTLDCLGDVPLLSQKPKLLEGRALCLRSRTILAYDSPVGTNVINLNNASL